MCEPSANGPDRPSELCDAPTSATRAEQAPSPRVTSASGDRMASSQAQPETHSSDFDAKGFDELVALLRGRRLAVLTGAGCSTESGIPDYRGPLTRAKARNPVQYRAFMQEPSA